MSHTNDIITAVQAMAAIGKGDSLPPIIIGTILSIDSSTTCTIQPQDNTLNPIGNILMVSDVNSVPMFVPAIGTQVSVSVFDGSSGVIVGLGAVKSAAIAGDTYGGLVIGSKLVQQLNDIQNQLNNILTGLQGVTVVIPSGGGSFPLASYFTETPLDLTQSSDIESTVVMHGKGTDDDSSYVSQLAEAQLTYDNAVEQLQSLTQSLNSQAVGSAGYTSALDAVNRQQVIVNDAQAKLIAIQNKPQ